MAKGMIKLLSMMIASLSMQSNPAPEHTKQIVELQAQRNSLLTNQRGPYPYRTPNQRQRRKLARQMNRF